MRIFVSFLVLALCCGVAWSAQTVSIELSDDAVVDLTAIAQSEHRSLNAYVQAIVDARVAELRNGKRSQEEDALLSDYRKLSPSDRATIRDSAKQSAKGGGKHP